MGDEKQERSEFETDTNAGEDAKQGTVADQDAEGTAPERVSDSDANKG